MIGAPMPIPSHATPRPAVGWRVPLIAIACLLLAACSSSNPTGAPQVSGGLPGSSGLPTATPSPTPTPTPAPSPLFSNPANPSLEALIPAKVAGLTVVKPPSEQYGITPGDIGLQYGQIGARFRSLAVAYIEPRKLSLFAMQLEGDPVRTKDLEPYLATAGRYVGINGLHREPWKLTAVGDHLVWVRPEDNATASGTMIYTWAAGDHVFLMIGTDDKINRALLAALPGETPPPTPSPVPSGSPAPSGSAAASGSAIASGSAASSGTAASSVSPSP
jgi:hypothetical protein